MNFLKMKALEYWEMLKNHWDTIETKQGLMWIVIIIVALIILGVFSKILLGAAVVLSIGFIAYKIVLPYFKKGNADESNLDEV